jgi:hypothetical protein
MDTFYVVSYFLLGEHMFGMWSTTVVTITTKVSKMLITGHCYTLKEIYCLETS